MWSSSFLPLGFSNHYYLLPQGLSYWEADGVKLSQMLCSSLASKGNTRHIVAFNVFHGISQHCLSRVVLRPTALQPSHKITLVLTKPQIFFCVLYIDRIAYLAHLLKIIIIIIIKSYLPLLNLSQEWYSPLIPNLGKQKQEVLYYFEASLVW